MEEHVASGAGWPGFLCKYLQLEKYEYVSTHGLAYETLKNM